MELNQYKRQSIALLIDPQKKSPTIFLITVGEY